MSDVTATGDVVTQADLEAARVSIETLAKQAIEAHPHPGKAHAFTDGIYGALLAVSISTVAEHRALIRLGGVRRRALEARVRELETLAGIEPPALEPEVKALPRMRWDPMHSTWRASA